MRSTLAYCHMVFSTLHTNDALSAVSRLIDMGVNPLFRLPCGRLWLSVSPVNLSEW